MSGIRSGTLCRVFLRGPNGARVPAGAFRYRWGDDSEAVLSSALDLSRTRAIGVRAGNRTFIAPVDVPPPAEQQPAEQQPAEQQPAQLLPEQPCRVARGALRVSWAPGVVFQTGGRYCKSQKKNRSAPIGS